MRENREGKDDLPQDAGARGPDATEQIRPASCANGAANDDAIDGSGRDKRPGRAISPKGKNKKGRKEGKPSWKCYRFFTEVLQNE